MASLAYQQYGRLYIPQYAGFWSPTLTTKDPQIPWLPLESPSGTLFFSASNAVAVAGGLVILQARLILAGIGIGGGSRNFQAQIVRAGIALGLGGVLKNVSQTYASTATVLGANTIQTRPGSYAAVAVGLGTIATILIVAVLLEVVALGIGVVNTAATFVQTIARIATGLATAATEFIAGGPGDPSYWAFRTARLWNTCKKVISLKFRE